MGNVRRIYVEKKPEYAVKAKELQSEIKKFLGITDVTGVRVLIRYDIENLSDAIYKKAIRTIFSEPPVDDVYEESFDFEGRVFSVEALPGQFDQRADSAVQCVGFLKEDEEPVIKSAVTKYGKPKMFKSATEGNYIVRLFKVSLKPEDKLGRMLHSFSCTAYEIADFTYENLCKLGFVNKTSISRYVSLWKTYNFKDWEAGRDIVIEFDSEVSEFLIQDLLPGTKIELY